MSPPSFGPAVSLFAPVWCGTASPVTKKNALSIGEWDGRAFLSWSGSRWDESSGPSVRAQQGDVESRLLLVRLQCLLAVGPHCWHISSMSDSRKLKMLGLSTDPISLWHAGTKRFSKVQMKSSTLLGSDPLWAALFCWKTLFGQKRIKRRRSGEQNIRSEDKL